MTDDVNDLPISRRRRTDMDTIWFERMVREAMDSLPPSVKRALENVEILIDDLPSPDQIAMSGLSPEQTLLGLYEGVPITARDTSYGMVLPDRVTLFRLPIIDESAGSRSRVRYLVAKVLRHELAHYFGYRDEELPDF